MGWWRLKGGAVEGVAMETVAIAAVLVVARERVAGAWRCTILQRHVLSAEERVLQLGGLVR